MLTYVGGGSLGFGGCGNVVRYSFVPYRFPEGSVLYSLPKATNGRLEKVVIKRVNLIQSVPLYVDTFNAFWNEDELTDEETAVALVTDYLLCQQKMLLAALCSPKTP